MKRTPEDDRWARSDWWGVVLDAPDIEVLARFYVALRGWSIWRQEPGNIVLDAVAHAVSLGAELPAHQPQENVRVLLDPAGHPFCLYAS